MYLKIDTLENSLAAALLFLFQVFITNGQDDYVFITQPPTQLQCNPHPADIPQISLECSIGIIGKSELPAGTRIVWYKRPLNSDVEEQLCESDVTTLMAVSPLFGSGPTLLIRSIVELVVNDLGDLTGEYWCQVAKTLNKDQTLLSNRSSVLSISNSNYYYEKNLAQCVSGSIFLEINLPIQVEFSSISSSVKVCPVDSNSNTTIRAIPTDDDGVEENSDDSFLLSRMWVYILVPVIATILIFMFLLLSVALLTTCIRKRDPKKSHLSTIDLQSLSTNIKLSAASNADKKIKSNGHLGNTTALPNIHNGTQPPTCNTSVGKGSSVPAVLDKKMLNKQQLQQKEEQNNNSQQQLGASKDLNSDDDEDYYYTDVLSRNDRKVGDVVGRLRSACTGSTSTETVSDCNSGGNLGYRSLDPEGMEPTHTYHATCMQSNAACDGPQPAYSEPDIKSNRNKILANGQRPRPSPPTKIPPRLRSGNRKEPIHVQQTSCRSSVDGEYVEPNSSDLNPHMYQGLTPIKQEYLALYMTPDSSPQ